MTRVGTGRPRAVSARRRGKTIGIIDLLSDAPASSRIERVYGAAMRKQYASLMPQAIAVWCRQAGYDVHYATFWGQPDPRALLPDDLDVVFVSAYTQASAMAYALARRFQGEGAFTVLGGPHARSFPIDALRFFDVVVRDCDRDLVLRIAAGDVDPGSLVTTERRVSTLPSIEERLPEIRTAHFYDGRPGRFTWIPMLSSVGCPYSCSFCLDWNTPYLLLSPEQLAADLEYAGRHFPGTMIAFYDPNFAVKFDQTLGVMEALEGGPRNPYLVETSLAILKGPRLKRLQETGCAFVAPGVESWAHDSKKTGVGRKTGREKLDGVVAHFEELFSHVPGLQANFIFGTDDDSGDEPVELTKEFMKRTPFVWPTVNIPMPFGGTPLYDELMDAGRILREMPLAFYYNPHLVTTLAHYDPIDYYEKLLDIFSEVVSPKMLARRLATRVPWRLRAYFVLRTLAMRVYVAEYRRVVELLRRDASFLAFHRGENPALPEYYHRVYEAKLGPYAALMSREDRTPDLSQPLDATAYLSA